ncbi:MAG TPA: hypothetical protein VMW80_02180 [Candidatus Dormibacteraeota bacterium]|nr:hypothetical protein [Candidatus Dormibacteraeota bacterium]
MPRITAWRTSRWRGVSGRDRGIAETTERVRQLVDGIESAITSGNDLALASYLAPPALGHVLAQTAAMRAARTAWLPSRVGLRWSVCSRAPEGPGRFWLRLRFDDRTEVHFQSSTVTAVPMVHEVEVELDTTVAPWRLCQAEEVFAE